MLWGAAWAIFLAVDLGAIAWIDFRRQHIPNALTGVLALGGLVFSYCEGTTAVVAAVGTAVVTLAVLLGVRLVYRRRRGRDGLGMGDVKLLAAAALWVGPFGISWLVLAACASALLTALGLRLAKRPLDGATRLPFGPHIALGLIVVLVLQAML